MYKLLITTAIIILCSSCDQGPYKKAMDLNKIGTRFYLEDNDSALYYFNKAIKTDSTFQPAIQNKANYHIGKQQYEEALETIDLLLAQDSYVEAFQMKGMLLDILGRFDEAQLNYKQAINGIENRLNYASKENESLHRYNLGFTYFLLNDTTKAIKLINQSKERIKDSHLGDSILNNIGNKPKIIQMVLN